jgi:hypothetical protein
MSRILDISALAESQVIDISDLRIVEYTLEFIMTTSRFEPESDPDNFDVLSISP